MAGYPILSDSEYDLLQDKLCKECPELPELNRLYDDDKIDYRLLEQYGVQKYVIDAYVQNRGVKQEFKYNESKAFLDNDNFSIISYKTEEDERKAFLGLGKGKYILTPKIDGIFISVIYERESKDIFRLVSAQTRGSASNAVDVTDVVRFMLDNYVTIPNEPDNSIKFNFEAYMQKEVAKQNGYATCKSGAQGILLSIVNKKVDKFKDVKFICHGCSVKKSLSGMYKFTESIGFNTVPTAEFEYGEISIDEVANVYKQWASKNDLEIDGIVVRKEDNDSGATITGSKLYKADTFAIKSMFWKKGIYTSCVENLVAEQRDSEISYTIEIKPLTVLDGAATITRLTNIRLATLIEQDINVGSLVQFEYLNGTTPKFICKVR